MLKMDPPFRLFTLKMIANMIIEISQSENKDSYCLKKSDLNLFNDVQTNNWIGNTFIIF